MKYKVCDRRGSHLDYGETCECVKEAEQEERVRNAEFWTIAGTPELILKRQYGSSTNTTKPAHIATAGRNVDRRSGAAGIALCK